MQRESSSTVRSESGWWRLQESSQARTEGAVRPWESTGTWWAGLPLGTTWPWGWIARSDLMRDGRVGANCNSQRQWRRAPACQGLLISLVQGRSVVLRWLQAQVEAQAGINRFQLLR
jgi:hypothetical protein